MTEQRKENVVYLSAEGASPEREFSEAEREALDQVNRKVAASQSLEEVLDFLYESMRAISPCDRVSFAFLDETGERLVSHGVRAAYEPVRLKQGFWQALRGSSLEAVIRSGTPRVIGDLEAYLAAHPQSVSTRLLVQEGVRSSLTCPLTVEGRIVGVLFRSLRRPHAYDDHQVRLHQAVAERLGQAAEKALLIERLTAANRAYREMLAFVSHELKNPLAGLVMEGRLLLEGYVGTLPPAQEERVRRIVGRAEYLVSLVRDYLDLAVIEGAELRLRLKRGVDVAADIVKPAVDLVEADFGESGMRLQVQAPREPARVDGDTELLKIVLVNLLGNAAKYGKRGGEARLTVGRTGTGVTLRVWNEGAGFREADRQDLFRRFTRLPTPEFSRVKGTGLGLYTAWRIVQMHQGRIGAASEYGKWAEFTVELPPAQGN